MVKSDTTSAWHLVSPWVRLTCGQTYLPVETSSSKEWYYFRSAWHLVNLWFRLTFGQMYPQYRHLVVKGGTTSGQLNIWSAFGSGWPLVRCMTHNDISWPGLVLLHTDWSLVIRTPTPALAPTPPPVETSCGQVWYYLGQMYPISC